MDVPLINEWFHEHCPQSYPVKVPVPRPAPECCTIEKAIYGFSCTSGANPSWRRVQMCFCSSSSIGKPSFQCERIPVLEMQYVHSIKPGLVQISCHLTLGEGRWCAGAGELPEAPEDVRAERAAPPLAQEPEEEEPLQGALPCSSSRTRHLLLTCCPIPWPSSSNACLIAPDVLTTLE